MLGVAIKEFDTANPSSRRGAQEGQGDQFRHHFWVWPKWHTRVPRDAYQLLLTVQEADAMIQRFLRIYKGVGQWIDDQVLRGRRLGFVETLGGRRYRFEWEAGGKFSPNLALNFPIQGTAAEIAVQAVIRIDARLRRDLPAGSLVVQVHDDFVLEVPHGLEDLAKRILVEDVGGVLGVIARCARDRSR